MTASNVAVDSTDKTVIEKAGEKLAEKRRALGRGLESLLPGPRVVPGTPTLPQSARKDGAPSHSDTTPDGAGSQVSGLGSQEFDSSSVSSVVPDASEFSGGRAGTPVAPSDYAVAGTLDSCRLWPRGRLRMGRRFFFWGLS